MIRLMSTWRGALLAYCLLFLVLMSPYLLFGDVVAPHRQGSEIGANDAFPNDPREENRKFNDFALGYIPAIFEQFHAARSGWLALWTNENELGRPIVQLSGLSGAYLPSWLLAHATGSPWHFITILSVSTCFLGGFFLLLFCRELGLSPPAGLTAGTSLAASPLFMYWLTFPMFPAVWCWSAGALLALIRLAKQATFANWSLLAFCAYSGLMTAYPQPLIFHAYLIGGYCLHLAIRHRQAGWSASARFLVLAGSAGLVGGALALPVYLDVARIASESARAAPDVSFFTAVLPSIESTIDAVRLLVLSTTPEFFGNPIKPSYPFPYDGVSTTIVVVFLAIINLTVGRRATWGWWLSIVVLFMFGIIHPLYEFGVRFLGFNVSRSTPLGSVMLPITIIAAYGADALVQRSDQIKQLRMACIALSIVLAIIAAGVGYGLLQSIEIRWTMVLVMVSVAALLAVQCVYAQPVSLLLAIVLVLATVSQPLMLRQDPAHIATMSPLIKRMEASLPAGSRFAIAAPGLATLPPNLNAIFGLASVHSYNSLSSQRYHRLIGDLGGDMQTYGRWNGMIAPDYDSATFWMSNVALVLAPSRLAQSNLEYIGEETGVHLHKVMSRMGDSIQIVSTGKVDRGDLELIDPRLYQRRTSARLSDKGDLLEFDVTPGAPSVLILSQKFDRAWEALVFKHSAWMPATTIAVNGVFQAVVLPSEAQLVRLQFKPYARFAWIAHVFWLALLVGLGTKTVWKFRSEAAKVPMR